MKLWQRAMRFYAVGAAGILVQLAVLVVLKSVLGVNYLVATVLAVEVSILHNYAWHERWTWRDRPSAGRLGRLLRFHAGNGLVSLAGNVVLMAVLVGKLGMPYVAANLFSIAACSVMNYVVGDRLVFTR